MPKFALITAAILFLSGIDAYGRANSESRSDMPTTEVQGSRLSRSQSPYLHEHADNPIDWYEWGREAFDEAREKGKLIFLSIGYLSCHWCHVMEEESFMDEEVARLLNENYISILVDREERPDIDSNYMLVSQMMTGRGGWPLNIIMTPDGRPFFSATYIPKDSIAGRTGLIELLPLVIETWNTERDEIEKVGDSVRAAMREVDRADHSGEELSADDFENGFQQLLQQYDNKFGGFGTLPKFPQAQNIIFLLRHWKRSGNETALEMAVQTLTAMRFGGIYDQVGFGFHRYSTDPEWKVPHFEKMLYDQAMLALAYIEAYQATDNPLFAETAEEILNYVLRDLLSPEGAFYSAEDADSEGEEGKLYFWSVDEIREILGNDAGFVIDAFKVEIEGNFNNEVTGRPNGLNILLPVSELFINPDKRQRWDSAREILLSEREKRIRPLVDTKILTDWNGLIIAAFARAGAVLEQPRYVDAAREAADFIIDSMTFETKQKTVELYHRYWNGNSGVEGQLDDYAYFSMGLIELYQASFDPAYLELAQTLNVQMLDIFWDSANGGLFAVRNPAGQPDYRSSPESALLIRGKNSIDAALPSGNSIAMLNLARLNRLTGNLAFQEYARAIGKAFGSLAKQAPSLYTMMLTSVDFLLGDSYEIVLVGDPADEGMQKMISALRKEYLPSAVVILKTGPSMARIAPYTEHYTAIDGKATAYVCQNFTCNLPTTDIAAMISQLM